MTAENDIVTHPQTEVGALALITLKPERYAAEVYQPFKTRLVAAIESMRAIDYDITTTKGMDEAKQARRLLADIRIDANKERMARKAPITQIGKLLESHYDAVEESVKPLECLFDDDIKNEEARKEAIKLAKQAEEAARIQAIADRISAISKLALKTTRMTAAQITEVIAELEAIQIDESFDQFKQNAQTAWDDAKAALDAAHLAATEAEAETERVRLAKEEETRKAIKEREELEAQRKEQARIAAEQQRAAVELAAQQKTHADAVAAQEAIAAEQRRKADENLRADAAAHTKRLQDEADDLARQHAAAMRKLEDERAAFKAEQDAAQKIKDDAAKLESDHIEALGMNADFSDDATVKEEMAAIADPKTVTANELIASGEVKVTFGGIGGEFFDMAQTIADGEPAFSNMEKSDFEPTDQEILDCYIVHFGGTKDQAIERLGRFNLVA